MENPPNVELPPGALRELSATENGPSLGHAAFTIGALALSLAAAFAPGTPVPGWLGLGLAGVFVGGTFPAFHEALHRTVFRSRAANDGFAWAMGLFQVASPTGYRAFHMHHHRHTHTPDDPEISADPGQLSAWPTNPVMLGVLLSGQPVLAVKTLMLVVTALLPAGLWRRLTPFLPPEQASRVRRESALLLAAHAAAVWTVGWGWLAALALGHAVMGPMLFCEHTGLPMEGSVLARTRSLRTWGWLSWFWWNMNLHAEHHGWPTVPWWRLPELSQRVGDSLPHRAGYGEVLVEAARRSAGWSGAARRSA